MGNSPITVGVRTDQTCYTSGSKIKGRVYVSISKEPQSVQDLMLKIVGEENVLVHHTTSIDNSDRHNRSPTDPRSENHYERATFCFLQMEYPLHTFPQGQLAMGQYEYPFEIQLPQNIPSTMASRIGESYCEVKYEVTATLRKANSGIFSPNPSAQQKLLISSTPPPSMMQQNRHLPLEHIPVKKCCCARRGRMGLEVKLDRTTVQPHDTVQVEFRCKNESSVKVKRLRVQLEQIIDWSCYGYHKTVRNVLDQRILHEASEFPELRSRKQRRRQDYFGAATQQAGLLPNEWRSSKIQIPTESQDSYSGRNIQVRHVLSVRLETKGCCTSNPEASTLIQIHRSVPKSSTNNNNNYSDDALSPSAPPDTFDSNVATPSAPPAFYDTNISSNDVPMAEAQVLPPDWNAQTAEVVNIPMAEAVVMDAGGKYS